MIGSTAERLVALYEALVWTLAYRAAWRLLSRLLSSTWTGSPPRLAEAALYIHVPFCRKPCRFCCFVRFPAEREAHRIPRYYRLVGLEAETVLTGTEARITHVHLGGGTPAICPECLAELVDRVRSYTGRVTMTVELHPLNLLDEHSYSIVRELGFDRVSVGVQSFHDHILAALGRLSHDARQALEAAKRAAGLARTVNIDLVWGAPGEKIHEAVEDLEKAMALGANQVTLYPLLGDRRVRHPRAYEMYEALIRAAWSRGWFNGTPWTLNKTHNISEYIHEGIAYIGVGLSSITFTGGELYANTFSLDRYERLAGRGRWTAVMKTRLAGYERVGYALLDYVEAATAAYSGVVRGAKLLGSSAVAAMYLAGESRRAVYAALTRFRKEALRRGL